MKRYQSYKISNLGNPVSTYVRGKGRGESKTETIEWAHQMHENRQTSVSKLRLPSYRLPLGRDHVGSVSHGIRNSSSCSLGAVHARISVCKQWFAYDSYKSPSEAVFSPWIWAGCRDLLGNRMQLIWLLGILMKILVSTQVPDVLLLPFVMLDTSPQALWGELTLLKLGF